MAFILEIINILYIKFLRIKASFKFQIKQNAFENDDFNFARILLEEFELNFNKI